MLTKRAKELLFSLAESLDDGQSPLNHDWLVEHHVTLDECYQLAGYMAAMVRVLCKATPKVQAAFFVAGSTEQPDFDLNFLLARVIHDDLMTQVPEAMRKMGGRR